MKEFDEIENLFSSAFEGAEITPPPSVKNAVDSSLFSRAKGGFFWGYSILLIALISGVVVAYQSVGNYSDSSKGITFKHAAIDEVKISQEQSETESGVKSKNIIEQPEMGSDYYNDLKQSENTIVDDSKLAKSIVDLARGELNDVNQLNRTEQKTDSKSVNPQRNKRNFGVIVDMKDREPQFKLVQRDVAVISNNSNNNMPSELTEQGEVSDPIVNDFSPVNQHQEKEGIRELLLNPPAILELYPIASRDAIHLEKSILNIEYKNPNRWSLLTYVGMQSGFNLLSSSDASSKLSVEEQGGLDLALETNYSFSRRFGAGVGVDYFHRDTKMIGAYNTTDSVLTGGSWVINNPSQPDSLQDSTYFETYDVTTSNQQISSLTRQTSIGVPIYLTYSIPIATRFSFRLSAGAHFSYYTFKVQFEDAGLPESSFSNFGVNAMLRPEFIYSFNRFGIGVYGKMTYDFNHGVNWTSISRQRYGFGGGVVMKYKF